MIFTDWMRRGITALKRPFVTFPSVPYQNIVHLRKNEQIPNIYDVEMQNVQECRNCYSIECHVVLYPYSRKICSKHLLFAPFEEYIKDILSHQKSAYVLVENRFHEIFGLLLGVIITFFFFLFKPNDLFSVQSVMSVIGAYIVGKEIWDDLERSLINLSKRWRVRYQESYYAFELERYTTLTQYSQFAKKHRYGKMSLLPEKIDCIQQSNSQTIRMYFDMKDLCESREPSWHILSIHIKPELLDELETQGFMFGVKLSFNSHHYGVEKHFELFQSLHRASKGCLNEHGEWIEDAIFYRKTFSLGRLKFFFKQGLFEHQTMVEAA